MCFLPLLCEKKSYKWINNIKTHRPSYVSELKLKALGVMREKHKAVRQSKASITEESYSATEEENRWETFNEA